MPVARESPQVWGMQKWPTATAAHQVGTHHALTAAQRGSLLMRVRVARR